MSDAEKRIADIAEDAANGAVGNEREFVYAIREALADPILRQQIENSALERAAGACDGLIHADKCAAAIRALKSNG